MEIFLGNASAKGDRAIDQCESFKAHLRSKVGHSGEGWFFKTKHGKDGIRGLAVEYDDAIQGAREKAQLAAEWKEWAWNQVERNVAPERTRIVLRR